MANRERRRGVLRRQQLLQLFNWQDRYLDEWVVALGQAVSPRIEIETGHHIVLGNQPLSWFFDQDESKGAIASGQYDIFVLQGEEEEPVNDKTGFHDAVRAYHAAITCYRRRGSAPFSPRSPEPRETTGG